jgi:hypothetical protein
MYPLAFHFDAVAALHVLDVPVTLIEAELAVMRRNVGEAQNDVAAFAAADQKIPFQKWDRVTASQGVQFSKHNRTPL